MPILCLPPRLVKYLQINEIKTAEDNFLMCLKDACQRHPELIPYCFKTNDLTELSSTTCFYVNGKDIRILMKAIPKIHLSPDDIIEIEPAIVGG
jgi:hypothetical protein